MRVRQGLSRQRSQQDAQRAEHYPASPPSKLRTPEMALQSCRLTETRPCMVAMAASPRSVSVRQPCVTALFYPELGDSALYCSEQAAGLPA